MAAELTSKEAFEFWLAAMDEALEGFLGRFPAPLRDKLDFSPPSLDQLETWILARYSSASDLLHPKELAMLDGLARYVGETFRQQIGGRWEIRLDDPHYAFYGLPQLTGFSSKPTPVCPHSLVTAASDRRIGKYLRTILENTQRRIGTVP